jgi:YidC/Oxa1 family membrane protein insertase
VGENYGLSIVIFAILTKIIMFPLNLKQAKSMEELKKVAPIEKNIREKYKGNKEKIQEELVKMYSEHKINPLGGCLPLLIQLPIILAMFYIVKQPLTYIKQIPVTTIIEYTQEVTGKADITDKTYKNYEIQVAAEKNIINMRFLGLDFGAIPKDIFDKNVTKKPNKVVLIIPVISLILSIWQTRQAAKNSTQTEEQKQQMKTMNTMMPILSAYISYIMPVALGVYWLLGSVYQIGQQYVFNKMLKTKVLLKEGDK